MRHSVIMIQYSPNNYAFYNVLSYCSAAIEALRKELADLKLQMMRNVERSDSIPRTPSSHSHSTFKGPPSPPITACRLNSHEYPPSSSQPKLLTREFSNNPSASSLPLHGIRTPSSHHTLTNGGRSSQMTTTSLTTNNTHANMPSSQHSLTNGGRSSMTTLITNNTDTDTPSHSSKSTTSPSHTYSSQGSSTTAVTKEDLTPKSSPSSSRQPSSIRLSTPALSSYASLKSTPIPTPQHSVTGHTMSGASYRRPNSITSGRYDAGPRSPSNGYASSINASDQLLSQEPGYDGSSDHYESDRVRYYHSSQPSSVATAPSIIRRLSSRGSVSHYRPPTYEEASVIPPYSNRATANSSFVAPTTILSAPIEPSDTKGCAIEVDPNVAGCVNDNTCCHCGERTEQASSNNNVTRSSHGTAAQRQVHAPIYNANPSHEQSESDHSAGSRGARVDSVVRSDHEMGHGPRVQSKDVSNVTSFNGAQTPMATSTPSRRSAVLNMRHIHAQAPYDAREKLNERFKASRDLPERENTAGMPAPSLHNNIPASRSRPMASNENNFQRYSSTAASLSPQNQRKRSDEGYMVYSTHSSPARSHVHGYSSGVSSNAQSSPGRGYSNARRASSPALYASARKKSYGKRIVKEHVRARHSENIGRYSEDSSSDSSEERHHDGDAYLSTE